MRRPNIKTNYSSVSKEAFVKIDVNDKDSILAASSALNEYKLVPSGGSAIAARTTFQNVESYTSVRDQFRRSDYEYFRSGEAVPKNPKEIIKICGEAYRRIGLIRNIIDLMGDFGAEGIRIVHPNSRIEKFYRGWFKRVGGPERTERFLNLLYRSANVIVKRSMAKIDVSDEKKMRSLGVQNKLSEDVEFKKLSEPDKRTIPYQYTFLNPLTLDVIGENISSFIGKLSYSIKIDSKLRQFVKYPKDEEEIELAKGLPKDIRKAILDEKKNYIVLDSDKVSAYFYKKDDWQIWADPLVYAVLDDLLLLEKMKLADLSALDGAISQVRLWKLGDLKEGIFPTEVAVAKLAEILLSNPGGGAFDLIWGPELTLEETGTEVYKFLGSEKYQPVLNSIYAGLGVPPTLTGASTASGFTNNYISLQTLIQRLEYGRSVVRSFWEQEIELVRQAMGFRRGAYVKFDNMALSDEAAQKSLLIQLADRDLIDFDTILERFGEIPEVVKLKLRKDQRSRKNKSMAEKAGPFHTAEKLHEKIVTALRGGHLTPEQSGIEVPVELKKQETPFDKQIKSRQVKRNGGGSSSKPKGQPQKGRPFNSKDSEQRTRNPKPIGAEVSDNTVDFLSVMIWGKQAQQQIADIVNPAILSHFNKKNLRSLSLNECKYSEDIRFKILCGLEPFIDICASSVFNVVNSNLVVSDSQRLVYNKFYSHIVQQDSREPTVDEIKLIQVAAYSIISLDYGRDIVQGTGLTEGEALSDATNNARNIHGSITVLSTKFVENNNLYTCILTYEYKKSQKN